eukprot:6214410-Pleurochrysis_carterae.AAC.1
MERLSKHVGKSVTPDSLTDSVNLDTNRCNPQTEEQRPGGRRGSQECFEVCRGQNVVQHGDSIEVWKTVILEDDADASRALNVSLGQTQQRHQISRPRDRLAGKRSSAVRSVENYLTRSVCVFLLTITTSTSSSTSCPRRVE